MDSLFRNFTPIFIYRGYKHWGIQYKNLRDNNNALGRSTTFGWYNYEGVKINQILLPLLQDITKFHCSFCDIKEVVRGVQEPTIEHFRPSSKYPLLSHFWHNLFLCCYSCQKAKMDDFDKNLLKPDRTDYSFDDYFIIDWETGEIIEKFNSPDPRYIKANKTIELYGLNTGGRPKARLRELKHFNNDPNPNIDEYSYRYFIKRA